MVVEDCGGGGEVLTVRDAGADGGVKGAASQNLSSIFFFFAYFFSKLKCEICSVGFFLTNLG